MADIFRKTLNDQEVAAGTKEPISQPKPVVAKPGVDFFKGGGPVDPAAEAAKQAALQKLLRKRGPPGSSDPSGY